jgi:putative ATP-dependent endonuclease of OLD family
MLQKYPNAYGVEESELEEPDEDMLVAVLGKKHGDASQYSDSRRSSFSAYHRRFKLGSKPAAHLAAMAELDDAEIDASMPKAIGRMLDQVKVKISGLPE